MSKTSASNRSKLSSDNIATRLRNNRTSTCLRNKRVLIANQDRWDYQVYRNHGNIDAIDRFGHFHSVTMETQQNPLQELEQIRGPNESEPVDDIDTPNNNKRNPIVLGTNVNTTANFQEAWLNELVDREDSHNINIIAKDTRCNRTKTTNATWTPYWSVLACFSLSRNMKYLFTITSNMKPAIGLNLNHMPIIHGIRTISMIWIIFGNSITLSSSDTMNNLFHMANLACSSRLFQALMNSTLAIDTFFMLSGLLSVMSFLRRSREPEISSPTTSIYYNDNRYRNTSCSYIISSSFEHPYADLLSSFPTTSTSSPLGSSASSNQNLTSNSKTRQPNQRREANSSGSNNFYSPQVFRPLLWLTLRYLRLTPTYTLVMGLAIILPSLGAGPFWAQSMNQLESANCRSNWWLNLLYVNNHISPDKLCLTHSWHLSNSVQFYLIALVLFGLYFYSFKQTTLLIWILLFSSSTAVTFALTSMNEFPPSILATSPSSQPERLIYKYSLFNKPWPHLPSFLVGILTGYLILTNGRNKKAQLAPTWRFLVWLFGSLIALSLINSLYPWNMGLKMDPIVSALHGCTFRTLWSICCALLIYELSVGCYSYLPQLLGWPGFQVTSRLTFGAYLLHPLIIHYQIGQTRERLDVSTSSRVIQFFGTLLLTYLSSILLALIIEGPSIQLERLIFSVLSNKQQEVKQNQKKKAQNLRQNVADTSNSKTGQSSSLDSDWSLDLSQDDHDQGSASKSSDGRVPKRATKTSRVRLAEFHSSTRAKDRNRSYIIDQRDDFPIKSTSRSDVLVYPTAVGARQIPPNSSLDADFQRKLAQAVSRGFKLRNRMAMAATGNVVTQPDQSDGAPNKAQEETHVNNMHASDRSWSPRKLKTNSRGPKSGSKLSTFVAATVAEPQT